MKHAQNILIGGNEATVCPPEYCRLLLDLFEDVGFCRIGPRTMVEQKISVPSLGQMDQSDMWLLTSCERHAQKLFS